MFTKQKNTDFEVLLNLSDKDFFNICANFKLDKDKEGKEIIPLQYKSKYINELCNDENLWRNRLWKYYGNFYPEDRQTWKNLYLRLVYYLDKYNYKKDISSFQNASYNGHLEVVKYLMSLPKEYGVHL